MAGQYAAIGAADDSWRARPLKFLSELSGSEAYAFGDLTRAALRRLARGGAAPPPEAASDAAAACGAAAAHSNASPSRPCGAAAEAVAASDASGAAGTRGTEAEAEARRGWRAWLRERPAEWWGARQGVVRHSGGTHAGAGGEPCASPLTAAEEACSSAEAAQASADGLLEQSQALLAALSAGAHVAEGEGGGIPPPLSAAASRAEASGGSAASTCASTDGPAMRDKGIRQVARLGEAQQRAWLAARRASRSLLRQEIAEFIADAAHPLGTQLWSVGRDVRAMLAAADAADASSGALGDEAAARRALAEALDCLRAGLASLHAQLVVELPSALSADAEVVREAAEQLEEQVYRAVSSGLLALYQRAQQADVAQLAERVHEMRALLPCDMSISEELWLLPRNPEFGPWRRRLAMLREAPPSEPLLPYTGAILALRTLPLHRTPCEKARVLLEVCEEIVRSTLSDARLRAVADGVDTREAETQQSALCADELLPLLVYVIIRSRMTTIPAELAYIRALLPEIYQHGSLGYALASFQCACRVALDLDWSCEKLIAPIEVDADHETIVE
ncbi:hypothetical protein AB1Y20_019884 [Prymnesium parvum]|uniref:VPS9 domain-containing protein n=1 Tax=Prymnesium parvum TaxID=97485 RepID=A0AB34JVR1_PRYPA